MFNSGHHCPFILHSPNLKQSGIHNQAMINWLDIRPTVQDWCGVGVPAELPGRSLLPILETPEPEGWGEVTFSHNFHEVIDYNPYRVLHGRRYKYVQNLASDLQTPLPTDLFRSKTWRAVQAANAEMMGVRPTAHTLRRAPEELYDIQADPYEATELNRRSSAPNRCRRYAQTALCLAP